MMQRYHECLARGEQASEEPFWEAVYREAIPGFVSMVRNGSGNAAQGLGIDRLILTSAGARLTSDEKRRGKFYPDVALEVGHIYRDGSWSEDGWINKDLQIDFLTYGWVPSQQAIVFPWPLLRRAWFTNRVEWTEKAKAGRDGFVRVPAKNPNKTTISYAIPTDVIRRACADALFVDLVAVAQRRAA